MTKLAKTHGQPTQSPGLTKKAFGRLLRHINRLKKNPTHMAGVALVEFGMDVDESMKALGITEADLAKRAKLSLRRIRSIMEPPLKANTRATDLSRVAKALGTEVSIRLHDKIRNLA